MKKMTRRFLSLLLALTFVLSLGATALAADGVHATCLHSYGYRKAYTGKYAKYDDYICLRYYQEYYQCSKCKTIKDGQITTKQEHVDHVAYTASATCNGYVQTWQQKCRNCQQFIAPKTVRCPNSPHTGACTALPLRIGTELEIA